METKKQLLKLFSLTLKNRANGTSEPINPQMLRYLTRKDLIAVIKKMHNGTIPKDLDLIEMENEALLYLVGDDMFIISYMIEKWCLGGESPQTNISKKIAQKKASESLEGKHEKLVATKTKSDGKGTAKASK